MRARLAVVGLAAVPHYMCQMNEAWFAMRSPLEDKADTGYAAPVQQLLSIGEIRSYNPSDWPDYCARFALGREHIRDLIRMACDAALNQADSTSSEVWAPLHAWRALGQMRAEEAVVPLLAFLRTAEADEAATEELPAVFGMIGQAAIPPISEFLSDRSNPELAVSTALFGIKEIAARHPECRAECVGILVRMLESQAEMDPLIGGIAVSALIDLQAVEAIDVIRDAFHRGAVDISIAGDAEDVEIALGLRAHRVTPAPKYMALPAGSIPWQDVDSGQQKTRAPLRYTKVGRNDPCPCGSGKKYKKCCLR